MTFPIPPARTVIAIVVVCCQAIHSSAAGEVQIVRDAQGHFTLLRDGEPYFIRGAGGSSHLDVLQKMGGNSLRTWGVETLEKEVDGQRLIDRCHELGLTVAAGLWVAPERHGFNYSDPAHLKKQREAVRAAVRKYKDHPALLVWGLGNEMEGMTPAEKARPIWRELNELAAIVKAEDPHHPVMTVIAGAAPEKVKGILEHYSNIDILGVNAYANAREVAAAVKAAGWQKSFVLSEYGPRGHWEVAKTPWGAAIEQSSQQKAANSAATLRALSADAADITLGSYCFYWGQKQETTSTWYGMFLRSGEKLPQVDAISHAWTGHWPANRCPEVTSFESELKEAVLPPGQTCVARMKATDPDGDSLDWSWTVTAESTDLRFGGDRESEPPSFPEAIVSAQNGEVTIRTPSQPGNYRLFGVVLDGHGGASAENICFRVEAK